MNSAKVGVLNSISFDLTFIEVLVQYSSICSGQALSLMALSLPSETRKSRFVGGVSVWYDESRERVLAVWYLPPARWTTSESNSNKQSRYRASLSDASDRWNIQRIASYILLCKSAIKLFSKLLPINLASCVILYLCFYEWSWPALNGSLFLVNLFLQ